MLNLPQKHASDPYPSRPAFARLAPDPMIYGITGNTSKERLWTPVAQLIDWLHDHDLRYCLDAGIAAGLDERGRAVPDACAVESTQALAEATDVVLSFGGDGTLLRSAHDTGANDTPLLGVNIGRLGFLADTEVETITRAIQRMEAGDFRVERRMALEAEIDGHPNLNPRWALNEFVVDRSGATGLIKIEVTVDGSPLNTYWADGLIVATPTGSTAYSLSTGGPIITPGCEVVILTPIAPHTLTVRPIVLPNTAEIQMRVLENDQPYVFAADGRSTVFEQQQLAVTVRQAAHTVNLIKFPDQDYFKTLRSKLMWGAVGHLDGDAAESLESVSSTGKS